MPATRGGRDDGAEDLSKRIGWELFEETG